MRVLVCCHMYPPHHNAGAEYYQHGLNKFLISKGHEVRCMMLPPEHPMSVPAYTHEGVYCFPRPSTQHATINAMQWADVIITYLDLTEVTLKYARFAKRPVVWIAHNTLYSYYDNVAKYGAYVVYNSEAAKQLSPFTNESFVLPPPVDYRHYDLGKDTYKNKYITIINANENKGIFQFYRIAKAMPKRQFLAVQGSYDPQIGTQLPNVTIWPNTSDIRKVYEQTRILLMPSEYESWGRTATEAACNGIPVICTDTFGLKENLADAGIFIERNDIPKWVETIRKLDTKKAYDAASKKVRERSRQLDPINTLTSFEDWIFKIAANGK